MPIPTVTWRFAPFAIFHAAALLLLGSWLFGPTRALWDSLDRAVFFILNGTLAWGESWQLAWASAGTRAGDVFFGLLMIATFLIYAWFAGREQRIVRLAEFGVMCTAIVISQEGPIDLFQWLLEIKRASPSLVLEPVYRLSELVPQIHAKDASRSCFPSDHGVVALVWLFCIWFYAGWRMRIVATLLCLVILLPRLIAGGHWLTDSLVGSASLALLLVAWVVFTPLGDVLQRLGEWILRRVLPRSWTEG